MTPGEKYYRMHQAGRRLTLRQAVRANCAACMGFYVDGRRDCEMSECPLHPWHPYRDKSEEVKRPSSGIGEGLRKWREKQVKK